MKLIPHNVYVQMEPIDARIHPCLTVNSDGDGFKYNYRRGGRKHGDVKFGEDFAWSKTKSVTAVPLLTLTLII